MHELLIPDVARIETWLIQAGYEFWMCDHCESVHFSELHRLDGVLDSRLFIQPFGILFRTELDLKLSSVMKLNGELGRFNLALPTIKLFMDIMDNGSALLVASDAIITTRGITYEQFINFLEMTIEAKKWMLTECHDIQVIYHSEMDASTQHLEASPSLH